MDIRYMKKAIALAKRATGRTSPNPLVGAVVVREGEIVGTGYHHKSGEPHAEIIALERAGDLSRGAELYVNLEPCNHRGQTPPCTEAIIKAGIKRVFISLISKSKGKAKLPLSIFNQIILDDLYDEVQQDATSLTKELREEIKKEISFLPENIFQELRNRLLIEMRYANILVD